MKNVYIVAAAIYLVCLTGCPTSDRQSSDERQRQEQEVLLNEATSQTGMPSIVNFRERKLLKDILELRDQDGLVTYTYLENAWPTVVPGHTVLGGKLTFLGESIGYGIPYATQYTNPEKMELWHRAGSWGYETLPQADPNALYSPASAEGTWVMLKSKGKKETRPVYIEPRIVVTTFLFPLD